MKTFEGIVQDLFYKPWTLLCGKKYLRDMQVDIYMSKEELKEWYSIGKSVTPQEDMVTVLYRYSKHIASPYYGADIGEPVIKICKRILEKPERFELVEEGAVHEQQTLDYRVVFSCKSHIKSLKDKDTEQLFVFNEHYTTLPDCLTEHESILLKVVAEEWYENQKDVIAEENRIKSEKLKANLRKELVDKYLAY